MTIDTLLIFAAGFGKRMKHVTENLPKPLIEIQNKPMLYHILESATKHGFKKIFINTHYLHNQINLAIEQFQRDNSHCPDIQILHEEVLLDTGGTVKNGIQYFGDQPIITHNADIILKGDEDYFAKLKSSWNPSVMDFLLLIHDTKKAIGYVGKGDFEIDHNSILIKPKDRDFYKYMYTGVAILKPSLIVQNPKEIFSLQEYYDNPEKIYGVTHKGTWCHVSCPEDIESTNHFLK